MITKEYADANYNVSHAAGSVIETFSLVANNSSVTVQSGTYSISNVIAPQNLSSDYADVQGSRITYTPPSNATSVVYEYDYSLSSGDTRPHINFDLYFDGNEVSKARHTQIPYYDSRHTFRWVFRIGGTADTSVGQVGSWTSGKVIKLRAREHSDSYEGKLHNQYHRSGAAQNNLSLPVLTITAIA